MQIPMHAKCFTLTLNLLYTMAMMRTFFYAWNISRKTNHTIKKDNDDSDGSPSAIPTSTHKEDNNAKQDSKPIKITKKTPDYEALRPIFGWLPIDIIKKTFKSTTQYTRTPMSTIIKQHYKSSYPAFNVKRRDETIATDTVYSDTPVVDDGSKQAQFLWELKQCFQMFMV